MTTWKSILTLTVAAAMVATTAFAQSSPSASSSTSSNADKSSGSTPSSAPSASPGTTPSDSTKSDTMKSPDKSDTMKSEKMSKHRGMRMSGGNREQVKAVQQALKDKGHDPGAVDGVMGPKTRSALKDFQKKEGMKDTGRIDHETMSKLGVEAKTSATGATSGGSASPSTTAPPAMSPPSTTAPSPGSSNSSSTEKK